MSSNPSPDRRLVPGRASEVWVLAFLVGVAGALTGALFTGLLGPAQRTAPLSLAPYVDPAWAAGPAGWAWSTLDLPIVAAVVLGLAAVALVLACDAAARRVFLASKPGAAALAAVVVLLAPAWGGVLKIGGHEGVLAGILCGAAGCALAIDGRMLSGAALLAFAALLHPASLAFAPVALGAARPSRAAVLVALACVALPAVARLFGGEPDGLALSWGARLSFGFRDLAAAPLLAFSPDRRLDVPTGFEALMGVPSVLAGLAIHALVLGLGTMIGGLRQAAAAAAGAAVSVLAAALLVPGWVPGDRAFALAAVTAYLPLLALVLAAAPERAARAALPGLVLGAGTVAVLLAYDRAPNWTALGAAMDFPTQSDAAAGTIRAVEREKDPARLILFLKFISVRDGVYAPAGAEAADALLDANAPALDPARLKGLLDQALNRVGRPKKTPEFKALAKEVIDEMRLDERLWAQSIPRNYEIVSQSMLVSTSKVLDLAFNWGKEYEGQSAVQAFVRLARTVIPTSSRAGYYEVSVPLFEALQLIGPESAETQAVIGIQRVLMGEMEKGRGDLEAALKRLPAKGQVTASARGALGLALLDAGDATGALRELQAAWNFIGAGGVQNVTSTYPVDVSDYYVVAEFLLARYQAAKQVDPGLAPQAARDLTDLLEAPLRFGVRRLPALGLMGKLELLQGNRQRGLDLLREARRIPWRSFDDRSDGAIGRIAHPRYRRMVLETLASAIADDPGASLEREEIAADLRELGAK